MVPFGPGPILGSGSARERPELLQHPYPGWAPHLEVGEVLLHEAVDLAHRQATCLAVLQGHGDQTAGGKMWGRPGMKSSQADSLSLLCQEAGPA